jgi:hypothetical protein
MSEHTLKELHRPLHLHLLFVGSVHNSTMFLHVLGLSITASHVYTIDAGVLDRLRQPIYLLPGIYP